MTTAIIIVVVLAFAAGASYLLYKQRQTKEAEAEKSQALTGVVRPPASSTLRENRSTSQAKPKSTHERDDEEGILLASSGFVYVDNTDSGGNEEPVTGDLETHEDKSSASNWDSYPASDPGSADPSYNYDSGTDTSYDSGSNDNY